MDKFGRNYILTIGTPSGASVIVQLPFTIEFDIVRNTLTSANLCKLRIYNLSLHNRNLLRVDSSSYAIGIKYPVTFVAGYKNNMAIVFSGNIHTAFSRREGINFITQIECFDGGFAFANSETSVVLPPGMSNQQIIYALMADYEKYGITPGVVGAYPGPVSTRQTSYNGYTADLIQEKTGGGHFIDSGYAHAIATNEFIVGDSGIYTVSAATGLLETPTLENLTLRFRMIFEPALQVGTLINLNSLSGSTDATGGVGAGVAYNGQYKITEIKHHGMISESVCGEAITEGGFYNIKPGTPAAGIVP